MGAQGHTSLPSLLVRGALVLGTGFPAGTAPGSPHSALEQNRRADLPAPEFCLLWEEKPSFWKDPQLM